MSAFGYGPPDSRERTLLAAEDEVWVAAETKRKRAPEDLAYLRFRAAHPEGNRDYWAYGVDPSQADESTWARLRARRSRWGQARRHRRRLEQKLRAATQGGQT